MTTRVLFAGMDGAGKSTLACSVHRLLQLMAYPVRLHEIDVWSDTHAPILGKKPWAERNKRGNDVRNYLADEFAAAVERFATDEHELVLGDLHGRWQMPDPEYWSGLRADHAVLVVRHPTEKDRRIASPQRSADWEWFLKTRNIPVALRVCSLLPGQAPLPGCLPVTGLERALRIEDPDVWQIAATVAELLERG